MKKRPRDFDPCCDCPNYSRRLPDIYLMAWTPAGQDRFLKDCFKVREVTRRGVAPGTYAEELLRRVIDFYYGDRRSVRVPGRALRCTGSVAGANRNYLADDWMKFRIRSIAQVSRLL
jgi:hypothetical protein